MYIISFYFSISTYIHTVVLRLQALTTSTLLTLITQRSSQSWFLPREENRRTRRKTLEAWGRTTHETNSVHIWPEPESNPGHSGERPVLAPLSHPGTLNIHYQSVWWVIHMYTSWILLLEFNVFAVPSATAQNAYFRIFTTAEARPRLASDECHIGVLKY